MFDVSRASRNPVMPLIFNKNFLGLQKLLDHSLSAGTKTQEYLSIVYSIAFVVNFFFGTSILAACLVQYLTLSSTLFLLKVSDSSDSNLAAMQCNELQKMSRRSVYHKNNNTKQSKCYFRQF